MADKAIREYRYERKFFIDQFDAPSMIAHLKQHPAMFSELYPPRAINNIYLDSPMMDNFFENENGYPQRRKARLRWYHDLFQHVEAPVLEFKLKDGWMGTKIQYRFSGFDFDDNFSERVFQYAVRSSDIPNDVRDYLLTVEPVLANCYQRCYYATPDQRFRVTIDSGLTFYHLNKFSNRFLFRQTDYQDIVVEMKYQREDDGEAARISAGFPYRMTRSSKYVQGIEKVYL
jgi:SPX domain protein involved in polyphosphate accumulation